MLAAKHQQGVAMIVAILVVSLASIIGISMQARHERDIRRTENILRGDQAWRYGMGAEAFVGIALKKDLDDNKYDHPEEAIFQPVTLPIEEGVLRGQITDHQGCFNINNLGGSKAAEHLAVLERLFGFLGVDVSIIQSIQDWMDADQIAGIPDGAEDGFYFSQTPAYRTSDFRFSSITELRLVKGLNETHYQKLEPQLCALPVADTAVNVNMASAELLAALAVPSSGTSTPGSGGSSRNVTPSDMTTLYTKIRQGGAFETTADFMADPETAGLTYEVALTTQTEWFLAKASATIGDITVSQSSLIKRTATGSSTYARSRLNF